MSSAFGTTDSFTVIQLGQWIVVSLRPRTLDAAQIFRVAAFDIGDLDDHLVLLAIALEAGALPKSGGGLLGKATTPGMAVISKASALMIMISSWVRLRSPHGLSLRKVVPCEPIAFPRPRNSARASGTLTKMSSTTQRLLAAIIARALRKIVAAGADRRYRSTARPILNYRGGLGGPTRTTQTFV